jgi:hypothetical protein
MGAISVSYEGLLRWNEDRASAVAKIEKSHLPLKILLKTKDDPVMLKAWIAHHEKIVGLGGLIIFDNMSSDLRVSEIYKEIRDDALVIRFSGFQDNVHHTDHFSELYSALRSSCSHFVFLDTDERLTLFDGQDHFRADPSIIAFLKDHSTTNVFPGTWLQNVTGYCDRFWLNDPESPMVNDLTWGLKWGKPVISSSCNFGGFINHNTQMEHSLYSEPIITSLFVLHLSRVSNQQRIDSNLRKLRAAGAISNESGVDEVLKRSPAEWSDFPETVRSYVQEILEIVAEGLKSPSNIDGSIQVAEDGLLIFSEEWQKQALFDFRCRPYQFVSGLLST